MATFVKTPSGTWKALIRRQGWPATRKTFRTKRDAEDWARRTEDEMVRGVYAGSAEGTYMISFPGQPQAVPTPFSGLFTQTFRHGGTGAATATGSMAGNIFDVEFPQVSIEVDSGCMATMKYVAGVSKQLPGQTFSGTVKYIVLKNGDELMGMETESNIGLPIELENHKRISMMPMFPTQ